MTQFPAEIVERVALAILNSHQRENEISERSELDAFDEPYRRDARVALEASGHAELGEALQQAAWELTDKGLDREAAAARAALSKVRGEA